MDNFSIKRINTKNLLENFCAKMENLSVEDFGINLKSTFVYKFGEVVIDDNDLEISDIAVDECDIIYLVDKKNKIILSYNKDSKFLEDTGCKGVLPIKLKDPSGIGIDRDTIYIADKNADNKGHLIALVRGNFQVRWILDEQLNEIIDITVGFGDLIYIIEKSGDKNRVIRVDRGGSIIGEPIGGDKLSNPTDIAVDNDGNIYILDEKRVHIFKIDNKYEEINITNFLPKGLSVDVNKQIFVGESGQDDPDKTIYKIDMDRNITPLWYYRGSTKRLINDSKGNLYVVSCKGHECNGSKLTFLEYKKIYSSKDGFYTGYYISKAIDSNDPQIRWHRFLLEGDFNDGTHTEFLYHSSNELLKDDDIIGLPENYWKKGLPDTAPAQSTEQRDALFLENVQGRYLWFKLILTGHENLSPAVRSLAFFFPRLSYLDYLPEIYQKDPVRKEFLERFLSIFESIFFEIEFNIEHLSRFFDAMGAPPEFLSWLGSWLAISMDDNWPDDKKRLFIQNAISIYKKRGTREGMEEIIELLTGQKPFIVENFRINSQCQNIRENSEQKIKCLFYPPKEAKIPVKQPYLFRWDEISGKDDKKIKTVLAQLYGDDWLNANIVKIDESNFKIILSNIEFLLSINVRSEKVQLKYWNIIINKFSVKKENCHLNVYKEIKEEFILLSDLLFGTERFCFCVFLKHVANLETIKNIIEEQKPAHTCYGLKILEPWFHLDMHTYLGVNTGLTKPVFILDEMSTIGRSTILSDVESAGQIKKHSRINADATLS